LSGSGRRAQLLETASAEFANTGLHGTTTAALAKAAGISEPVLYLHFESKERLFREAIERNIEERLCRLDAVLSSVAAVDVIDCVRGMAEATVLVGLSDEANAVLTAWAVLEAPEYAVDLHRSEFGSICLMWERRLTKGFPEVRSCTAFWTQFVHQSVHACVAYGSWLAALRHTAQSAAALARQFAAGIAQAAASAVK
jgi:AcrR family transcriptional regulator